MTAARHLALVPDTANSSESSSTSSPQVARGESGSDALWSAFLSDLVGQKDFQGEIKHLVESRIADVVARATTGEVLSSDNPFDAIYLSELAADVLSAQHISRINKHSAIKDLSEQLKIDDQWDD